MTDYPITYLTLNLEIDFMSSFFCDSKWAQEGDLPFLPRVSLALETEIGNLLLSYVYCVHLTSPFEADQEVNN